MELHGNNYLLANADLAGRYFPECVPLCVCVCAVKSAALQLNAKRVIATETSLRFHLTSVLRSGQATAGREQGELLPSTCITAQAAPHEDACEAEN